MNVALKFFLQKHNLSISDLAAMSNVEKELLQHLVDIEDNTEVSFSPEGLKKINGLILFMMDLENRKAMEESEEEDRVEEQPEISAVAEPVPKTEYLRLSHEEYAHELYEKHKQAEKEVFNLFKSELRVRRVNNGWLLSQTFPKTGFPDMYMALKALQTAEYVCKDPDDLVSAILRWSSGRSLEEISKQDKK